MSFDKLVNDVRSMCEQGKYRHVLELFDRSKELTLRFRENPDAAMKQFNPSKHTMGYLLALKFKLEINVGDPEVFLQQMTHLAEVFHLEQARKLVDILAFAFHILTSILVDRKQPQRGLLPLLTAIRRIRETSSHLTSIHADYLCLCLAAKNLPAALSLLDTDILNLNYEGASFDSRSFLLYFYYGGYIYSALKKFSRALYFFEVCLTTPSSAISAIQVEAYKKYVLVSLLLHGKLRSLPKYTSHAIERYIRNITGVYNDLATAYVHDKKPLQEMQIVLQSSREEFVKDQNSGLVKQCFASLVKRSIQRLTKTFITLSLKDLSERVGLEGGPQEAEHYLLQMIEAGEIHASIDQTQGMISFQDEQLIDGQIVVELEKELRDCMFLGEMLKVMNMNLSKDPKYVRKTKSTTSGTGFEDSSIKEILSV
ncbi:hypothetical protein LOD99_503 [Oopsacas minuta]|uniref:COP9 signalosome complex subunit 3 n=1 Tax=Oopsacas minuta TaxID=111878 RepID=A0AAV7KAN9_9METZ|nr:hypothetical protein LOD99_503 [Oopsacas minuta]